MDRRVHVSLLSMVVVIVATLAGAVAASGDDARSSTGATAAAGVAAGTDVVYVHRRVLSSSIQSSVLSANQPACLRSCTARGQPYTGRGCTKAYQCKG
ncbi:hypothetical protein E2562_031430 [Oryza meyeriana var. granulata]|uniref:Uncharacterized protein n=1 Tax=Oryza meyeriana var. granulata TaxID=110450 RepID=A0A6G1BZV3_9ORYZ|nr:hypothetical protein E2562_031430 [Oryza meyeriana var. granulata]